MARSNSTRKNRWVDDSTHTTVTATPTQIRRHHCPLPPPLYHHRYHCRYHRHHFHHHDPLSPRNHPRRVSRRRWRAALASLRIIMVVTRTLSRRGTSKRARHSFVPCCQARQLPRSPTLCRSAVGSYYEQPNSYEQPDICRNIVPLVSPNPDTNPDPIPTPSSSSTTTPPTTPLHRTLSP